MTHSVKGRKLEVSRLLRFSGLVLGIGILWAATTRASQIVVPGLSSERFIEAWIEGDLLLMRTEDGRLYSVPVGSVELESIPDEEAGATSTAPTISDINELLLAGVSEPTIKAFLESSGARIEISKEDILSLKQAGASEAFIQYLIFRGRTGPVSNYVIWRGPSAPRREAPPTTEVRETVPYEDKGGIPYVPYVLPGFGAYYPIYPGSPVYPGHPIYPGSPSYPAKPGHGSRGNMNYDLPPGARPGYYWPETRSLMKPSKTRPGRPEPEPHHQGRSARTGGLWLRWKGGSNPAGSWNASRGGESYSSLNDRGAPSSSRAYGAVRSWQSTMSTGSSGRAGGHASSGVRSVMGSSSATRSRGGTRSAISKKQ